jgi:hypothetical protein
MVNVRMDDEDIAYLDQVGPTRSDALRKTVAVCRRDHTVESVRSTPVTVSRLANQRAVPSNVTQLVPRETLKSPSILEGQMSPANPISPPTVEYLEAKEAARARAEADCPHPIDSRLGRKPNPVICGECGRSL